MIDEYTVLDVEIEWGETSAVTRKRQVSILLQGEKQERYSFLNAEEEYRVPLTNFGDVLYFIHQNLDTTPANEHLIEADGGSTLVQLNGGATGGEITVLPKIGPKTTPTSPEKGYVDLTNTRPCNNVVIGAEQNG